MKKPVGVVAAVVFSLALAGTARAAPVYLWGTDINTGASWVDANKTGVGDNLLCWAASTSNMLAWAGWGGGTGLTETQQIFNYFNLYWPDSTGSPMYGTEWWFHGVNASTYDGTVFPTDGGGFYPGVQWRQNAATDPPGVYGFVPESYPGHPDNYTEDISSVSYYVTNGIANAITINGAYSHSLTVWGIDWDGETDTTGTLWVTDSDTGLGLDPYAFHQAADGYWYLDSYMGFSNFRLTEVHRVSSNILGTDPVSTRRAGS